MNNHTIPRRSLIFTAVNLLLCFFIQTQHLLPYINVDTNIPIYTANLAAATDKFTSRGNLPIAPKILQTADTLLSIRLLENIQSK